MSLRRESFRFGCRWILPVWILLTVLVVPLHGREWADLVILNGHVLTMDPHMNAFPHGGIAVRDRKIVAIGQGWLIRLPYAAAKTINARGGIVMPGMVNAHTHVPMVAFRSLAEEGVRDRLFRYIFPLEAKLVTPDMVYQASLYGAMEMAMAGVTT